jgi:hypothetical protein
MADGDVAVEEIARLVGHASSNFTEPCTGTSCGPS